MNDAEIVRALREKARALYEGKITPHRSCGIAIASTFDRDPRAYQALRKGGITGEGTCGAILGGLLVLGELLGDPDPTGPATEQLSSAAAAYQAEIACRIRTGTARTLVCNDLVGQFPVFQSEERVAFCTELVTTVAAIVAELAMAHGAKVEPTYIRGS